MITYFKNLLVSQYNAVTKDALKLGIGAVIAQIISFVFAPVIARIYSPDEFGYFSTFTSFTSIMITLGSLKYELAIVLPKEENESKALVKGSFLILLMVSIIFFVIIVFSRGFVSTLIGNTSLKNYLLITPIIIFLVGLHNIIDNWNNRKKEYKLISYSRVVQTSSNSITSVILGSLKFGFMGLILGNIISEIISIGYLSTKYFKKIFELKEFLKEKFNKTVLKDYKNFPYYILPSSFIDILSKQIPVIFIANLFNPYSVGIYALAYKIIYLPMSIVGIAFSQPFYKEFTDWVNDGKNPLKLLYKTWINLFLIGIIPTILILFEGRNIILLLFGEKWIKAGYICSIMSFMMISILVSYPTTSAFLVLGLQKHFLIVSAIGLILRPLSIYFGSLISFNHSIFLLMISELVIVTLYNVILLKNIKKRFSVKEISQN